MPAGNGVSTSYILRVYRHEREGREITGILELPERGAHVVSKLRGVEAAARPRRPGQTQTERTVKTAPANPLVPSTMQKCTVTNGSGIIVQADVGFELRKTDGTEQGTVMVKNINPGAASFPLSFAVMNGVLAFVATDGTSGFEPWRTDGTGLGTFLVKDICPGACDSIPVI